MPHLAQRRRCTRARQWTRAADGSAHARSARARRSYVLSIHRASCVTPLRPSRVVRRSSRARSRRRSAPRTRPRHPWKRRDEPSPSPSSRASSWRTALPEKRRECACGRSEPTERCNSPRGGSVSTRNPKMASSALGLPAGSTMGIQPPQCPEAPATGALGSCTHRQPAGRPPHPPDAVFASGVPAPPRTIHGGDVASPRCGFVGEAPPPRVRHPWRHARAPRCSR